MNECHQQQLQWEAEKAYEFAVKVRGREIRKVIPKYNISQYKPPKVISFAYQNWKESSSCRTRKHSQQREDKGGIQCTESTHTTWYFCDSGQSGNPPPQRTERDIREL